MGETPMRLRSVAPRMTSGSKSDGTEFGHFQQARSPNDDRRPAKVDQRFKYMRSFPTRLSGAAISTDSGAQSIIACHNKAVETLKRARLRAASLCAAFPDRRGI